jgi:hypothetical protein
VSKKPRKRKKRKERTPNIPDEVIASVGGKSKTPGVTLRQAGDFNPDYSYVIKDLRRIGALAASFIVVLIILSLVLK